MSHWIENLVDDCVKQADTHAELSALRGEIANLRFERDAARQEAKDANEILSLVGAENAADLEALRHDHEVELHHAVATEREANAALCTAHVSALEGKIREAQAHGLTEGVSEDDLHSLARLLSAKVTAEELATEIRAREGRSP